MSIIERSMYLDCLWKNRWNGRVKIITGIRRCDKSFLLECMPRGQERYIVDQHDGEVLLVSRNSKQVAAYKAYRPTLIANSVFVIFLDADISGDYLACWMRGRFAARWLHDGGKMLSKKTLSIKSGDRLAAYAIGDTVMLKPVRVPTEEDFKAWLDEAQAWAGDVGLTQGDIDGAIAEVRAEARR